MIRPQTRPGSRESRFRGKIIRQFDRDLIVESTGAYVYISLTRDYDAALVKKFAYQHDAKLTLVADFDRSTTDHAQRTSSYVQRQTIPASVIDDGALSNLVPDVLPTLSNLTTNVFTGGGGDFGGGGASGSWGDAASSIGEAASSVVETISDVASSLLDD